MEKTYTKAELIEMIRNAKYDEKEYCYIISAPKKDPPVEYYILKELCDNITNFCDGRRYNKDFGKIEKKKCMSIGTLFGKEIAVIQEK